MISKSIYIWIKDVPVDSHLILLDLVLEVVLPYVLYSFIKFLRDLSPNISLSLVYCFKEFHYDLGILVLHLTLFILQVFKMVLIVDGYSP